MTMLDDTPDYSTYSLAQLEDVRGRVNRDKFPDRYTKIVAEIEKRGLKPGGVEEALNPEKLAHNRKVFGFSALFLSFSVWVFLFGFLLPILTTLHSKDWKETPCVIGRSRDENGVDKVVFRYSVDGENYESAWLRSSSPMSQSYAGKRPKTNFPIGQKTICFVDPTDPTQAVLKWGFDWWSLLFALGWSIFIVKLSLDGLKHPERVRINRNKNPYETDNG